MRLRDRCHKCGAKAGVVCVYGTVRKGWCMGCLPSSPEPEPPSMFFVDELADITPQKWDAIATAIRERSK